MKQRIIVFIICFVVVFGAGAGTYLAYSNHKEAVEFDGLTVNYAYVDSKGVFKGNFSTKKDGMHLCEYEHEIKGDTMYITFYQSTNEEKSLKHDKDNYATIEITGCTSVKKLYYRYNGEKDQIKLSN